MSYTKTAENTYLATNGLEYYGWIGRHILDSDEFYSSKSELNDTNQDEEHPLEHKNRTDYKEKYCWGCEKHKDVKDFPFVSHRGHKRRNLCRDCYNYAMYGEESSKKKKTSRDLLNKKRINDPILNFSMKIRSRISASIRSRSAKSLSLLGCPPNEAYDYLVSKFTDDMTEEAFSKGEIHIDHIRPVASFDLEDPEQLKQCFHYTNLQPLWASDNFKKSDKW